MGTFSFVGQVV